MADRPTIKAVIVTGVVLIAHCVCSIKILQASILANFYWMLGMLKGKNFVQQTIMRCCDN